jgi:DNA-binding response OmpR family regulator
MSDPGDPVVLLVEDEPGVAEIYEYWLSDNYEVRWADTGEEALDVLGPDVDVVLLDRMLPGMSGSEVLGEIRKQEAECRVAMVSAVDPGFDVVEMGFDEYITKPPSREELTETVDRLLERASLNDEFQEYYSLVAQRSALESEFSREELKERDAYTDLVERIGTQQAVVDERSGDLGSDIEFVGAVREIMHGEEGAGLGPDGADEEGY